MNVVVLGGTKGMGRALSRKLAARGDRLFLLGRDAEDLERSIVDLEVRKQGSAVGHGICDLEEPQGFAAALDAAAAALGRIECVVVTAGLFGTQEQLEEDLEFTRRVLTVNYAHTVLFCEHARKFLMDAGGGTFVFSSVAGDRGRKPVALYGSSKAGLSHYLESLDHKYRADGLVTICVKPGFVKTGMTEGLKPPPFAGEPDGVADRVIHAIDRGKPLIYAPFMWGLIMMVIRMLPRFVMRKVGF